MLRVDIGVFARDEANGIAAMIAHLGAQRELADIDVRVLILANGCRDDTAARAAAAGAEVAELPQGGKSRTWNRFVHDLSRPNADLLIFCDADIEFPEPDSLARLIRGIVAQPDLWVLNSQPVKDTAIYGAKSMVERLALRASGGLNGWKTAICGQLYVMPAARARAFRLPIGLPVEDGFLRAMVLTDNLSHEEDVSRIDGQDGVWHIYKSETTLTGLVRHQERIVIGGAINATLFAHLVKFRLADRPSEFARLASDEKALSVILRASLPSFPYGFVPFQFLIKRLSQAKLSSLPMVIVGVAFDAIVYVKAQLRMAHGTGAGFW